MNDLSLGRLRIANPDEGSPETPLEPQMPDLAIPAVQQLPSANGAPSYDFLQHGVPADDASQPLSTEQPPTASHVQSRSPPGPSSHLYQRKDNLSQTRNIPVTYQDQQQAQFPRYPAMMPQNLQERDVNGAAAPPADRPASLYYTNLPVSYTANGLARQSSTRSRDLSGTETPARTSSKRLPPMSSLPRDPREEPYVDRYRQPSQNSGNGYGPQRRTSRNLHSAQLGSTPTNQTPLSGTPRSTNTPLSSSPYNLDGGPLSSTEDWQDRGAAVGVQRDYDANGQPILKAIKKGVRDFNFGATLGEGSYSTVLAAKDRQTQKDYAIKVLDKRHIIKEKKVKYVNIEKEALNRLTDHPGVVRLYYTFQDERSLYFVLDLCSGGELLGVLKRMTTFDEECTRFYSAQILDTVEYMHNRGVIHRDLKPENVLLDEHKYIKITDFGTAKMLKEHRDQSGRTYYDPDSSHIDDRANSFVGTAEYVSPELLTDKNACKASDLWAFGCILYQLLAGRPPFKAANEYLTFQKIVALEYEFPRGFPPVARDLVERLLVLDPTSRLAIEHIKSHEFFQGVRWGRPLWQQKAPWLKPYVPPPQPPIRLNSGDNDAAVPPVSGMHSTQPTMLPPANVAKPNKPRLVTELPPPTELDIEWSPVLTRSNERILKLGNMVVNMGQGPYSPDSGNKLSRFFTGNTTKKRQRLVMVTSSARIILAAAGGEEKKSKSEINLLSPEADIMSATDSKGMTHWTVSTRDKHYTFEDLKTSASAAETSSSALSTQEWLEAIDTAKEIVNSQGLSESAFQTDSMASPSVLSHSSTLELNEMESTSPSHGLGSSYGHSSRGVLTKQNNSGDNDSLKGRKRFSKRQSKSGLTAVF